MADNYLEFSEVLANLTEPEEAWLKEQLQPVRVFGDNEYPEDAVPAELADADQQAKLLKVVFPNWLDELQAGALVWEDNAAVSAAASASPGQ